MNTSLVNGMHSRLENGDARVSFAKNSNGNKTSGIVVMGLFK